LLDTFGVKTTKKNSLEKLTTELTTSLILSSTPVPAKYDQPNPAHIQNDYISTEMHKQHNANSREHQVSVSASSSRQVS
jgi:hypothetical protein